MGRWYAVKGQNNIHANEFPHQRRSCRVTSKQRLWQRGLNLKGVTELLPSGFGCAVTKTPVVRRHRMLPEGTLRMQTQTQPDGLKRSHHAGQQDPKQLASLPVPFVGSHQQCIGTMAVRTFRYRVRFLLPLSARRIRVGKQVKNPNIMNVERKEKSCPDTMVGNVDTVNINEFHIQLIYFPLSVLSSTFKKTRVLQRLMRGVGDGRIILKLKGRSDFQWRLAASSDALKTSVLRPNSGPSARLFGWFIQVNVPSCTQIFNWWNKLSKTLRQRWAN